MSEGVVTTFYEVKKKPKPTRQTMLDVGARVCLDIISDVSDFLCIPHETVKQIFKKGYMQWYEEKLRRYEKRFGVARINEINADDYKEFQKENQLLYFFELCGWERHRKNMIDRVLSHFNENNRKILDFGCGIGTNAIAIAERFQVPVDIWDLDMLNFQFAKWRLKKIGFLGKALGDLIGIDRQYDAILCWLVFEYTRDPEMVLATIYRMLKKGGKLVYSHHFSESDRTTSIFCSMHKKLFAEHFEDYAMEIGFSRIESIPYKVFHAGVMYK